MIKILKPYIMLGGVGILIYPHHAMAWSVSLDGCIHRWQHYWEPSVEVDNFHKARVVRPYCDDFGKDVKVVSKVTLADDHFSLVLLQGISSNKLIVAFATAINGVTDRLFKLDTVGLWRYSNIGDQCEDILQLKLNADRAIQVRR